MSLLPHEHATVLNLSSDTNFLAIADDQRAIITSKEKSKTRKNIQKQRKHTQQKRNETQHNKNNNQTMGTPKLENSEREKREKHKNVKQQKTESQKSFAWIVCNTRLRCMHIIAARL